MIVDSHFIVNMITKYFIPVFCFILLEINALNCRTEGSLKSEELKKIYSSCVKQYEGKNTDNSKNSSEQDWRDNGSDQTNSNRDRTGSEGKRNKNNGRGGEDARNWMDGRIYRKGGMYKSGDNGQISHEDQDMNGRNQYSDNGQSHSQNERQNDRNRMNNNNRRMNGRNNPNSYQQNDHLNEQETFFRNDEYGSESQSRNMYTNSNYRYKRGRSEKNSGQRSQYNPNTKFSDDNHRESRNSSDSSKDDGKACAMHCFLDNLKMTGENGMPDRYLVTNVMTKDVRNEDLRDFLQESVEECFQILDNENTEDKCEFSKNLLICLSEKGRATCDDWKDDIKFT